MTKLLNPTICIVLAFAAGASGLLAAPATQLEKTYADKIDELMPGMGAKAIPDRKDAQLTLEKMCFEASAPGKETERAALSRAIMTRVGPGTAEPARVWLLRKIESLGRDEVVGGLTKLLHDEDPQICELARRALQNNPSPSAAEALRQELDAAKDDKWRIALINALGFRKDAPSVGPLGKLAGEKDIDVATAAVAALGKIGTDDAIAALAGLRKAARPELRGELTDAWLRGAESLMARGGQDEAARMYEQLCVPSEPESVRIAALQGLVAAQGREALPRILEVINGDEERMRFVAAQFARDIPGPEVTRQLAAAMKPATPQGRAMLLDVLGQRGDASVLPDVIKEVKASDPNVRIAALGALRSLGNASTVELLAERAANAAGDEREAARDSLARLQGRGVDEAVLKAMSTAQASVRGELIRAAAARWIGSARQAFFAAVDDPDESVRVAGVVALAAGATGDEFPRLLDLLGKVDRVLGDMKDPALKSEAADALLAIAVRVAGKHQGEAVAAIERLHEVVTNDATRARAGELLDSLGTYCVSWLFSGPFQKEGTGGGDLIDVPFDPENAQASAAWKPLAVTSTDQPGNFDLGNAGNCCAYVKTSVWSDSKQEARLEIGSDDGVKAWLNGTVVHAKNVSRGVNCGEDKVRVTLEKGWNPLMLKITQGGGGWGFCCAVRTPEGGRVKGLRFKAD